jgi:hypothetical protein
LWVFAVQKLDLSLLNGVTAVHVKVLIRAGGSEVVGGEVGRPILFLDGKGEKQTVVGVTPVQNVLSRGPGEQQEPIHVTPLKIGFVVDKYSSVRSLPLHFLTTHPIPL